MKRILQPILVAALALTSVVARAQSPGAATPPARELHDPILMVPGPEAYAHELPPAPMPDDLEFDIDAAPEDLLGMPDAPMDNELVGPGPQQDGQLPPAPRKPDPKKLEELKQRILEIKYDRMKKAVAMDDETWQKFFKIYKPAETDIAAIVKERNEEMRKLGQMMNGAKSDADVDPEMQRIRDLNRKIEDRVSKLNDDLKPVLSPRQRARLLVFEHKFNARVREEIMKRRGRPGSPEERRMRQQRLKEWRMKHPGGPPIDGPPPPADGR